MLRSIEQWVEILGACDATNCSAEEAIAGRIMGDLIHYRNYCRHEDDDRKQLANALCAYARLCHTAGFTP